MAWTTPQTWTVGMQGRASDLNTYLSNNLSFLATPPSCRVYRNAALTLNASYTNTVIPFDTVQWDTANGYNTSTNYYQVQVAGTYLLLGNVTEAAGAGGIQIGFYYNGTAEWTDPWTSQSSTANFQNTGVGQFMWVCAVSDRIACSYQSQTALAISTGSANSFGFFIKVSN